MISEIYVSPACSVSEIEYEGILCLSGQHEGIRQDENGDLDLFNF